MDFPPVPYGMLAMFTSIVSHLTCGGYATHVATGEIAALKHEVWNDAVELGAGIAKALLAGAEGAEVLHRLGYDIVEEFKVDATLLLWIDVSN